MKETIPTPVLVIAGRLGGTIWDNHDGSFTWTAAAMVDVDGRGPHYRDPDAQSATSLRKNGLFLNADVDHYVVVPQQFPRMIGPKVLGCKAMVQNHLTGQIDPFCVVGDLGPKAKLGEYARVVAKTVGVPPSPVSGGEERHIIQCTIWPGIVADGYQLQAV